MRQHELDGFGETVAVVMAHAHVRRGMRMLVRILLHLLCQLVMDSYLVTPTWCVKTELDLVIHVWGNMHLRDSGMLVTRCVETHLVLGPRLSVVQSSNYSKVRSN